MTIALIITSILLVIAIVAIAFLVSGIKILNVKLDIYESWIVSTRNKSKEIYIRLKNVDDRNLFAKDDDVGFVFTEILELTEELDKFVNEIESEENNENT